MGNKADNVVKAIGDLVIERLNELEDEFEYEYDEYGFDSASYSISFCYELGDAYCDGDASVWWHGNKGNVDIEVNLYPCYNSKNGMDKKLDRLQDAVTEYVFEKLDTDAMLDAMEDKLRDASMDEWQQHGFRDAADYYHWRYG